MIFFIMDRDGPPCIQKLCMLTVKHLKNIWNSPAVNNGTQFIG